MRGGDGPGNVLPKVAPSHGGLDQWVSSAKVAELMEKAFRGLTYAGSRNNVLVG